MGKGRRLVGLTWPFRFLRVLPWEAIPAGLLALKGAVFHPRQEGYGASVKSESCQYAGVNASSLVASKSSSGRIHCPGFDAVVNDLLK